MEETNAHATPPPECQTITPAILAARRLAVAVRLRARASASLPPGSACLDLATRAEADAYMHFGEILQAIRAEDGQASALEAVRLAMALTREERCYPQRVATLSIPEAAGRIS